MATAANIAEAPTTATATATATTATATTNSSNSNSNSNSSNLLLFFSILFHPVLTATAIKFLLLLFQQQ